MTDLADAIRLGIESYRRPGVGRDIDVYAHALLSLERLEEQLRALEEKPDQLILNAARRLVKATDNAERNYALADLVVALEMEQVA